MADVYSPSPGLVVTSPFQDVIQGVIQGAQLHRQLMEAQDQHDAMQRQAVQQQRGNRLADIQQRMLDEGQSRPVNPDGTVQDTLPANTPGMIGAGGQPFARKADKSRTYSWQDQNGQTIQRELMTPEEQTSRQAKSKAVLANAGNLNMDLPEELRPMFGGQTSLSVPPTQLGSTLRDIMTGLRDVTDIPVDPEIQKRQRVGPTLKGKQWDLIMAKDADEQKAVAKSAADAKAKAEKEATDKARFDSEEAGRNQRAGASNAARLAAAKLQADPFGIMGGGQPQVAPQPSAAAPAPAAGIQPAAPVIPAQQLPRGIGGAPSTVIKALYLQAAGGDPVKAKQMLQANKWRVDVAPAR